MDSASICDESIAQVFVALKLTPREAEVLLWISRGKSNHEIAVILGAKTRTICKHVEHVLTKLNVENRTSAAVMALETYHSVARTSEGKFIQPWASVAGLIATQVADLCLTAPEIFSALA